LFKILGDEVFESLGDAFIDAHPSVHRSIRWYGRELADFLAQRPPYAEQPILAEIARFEWTLSEVFDAADAAPVGRDALQEVDPGSWDRLGFEFHPSVRLLDLTWNTVAVWQAMSRDEDPPRPEAAETPIPWLLWRRELTNRFRSLDEAECAALEAARSGEPFGEICAALRAWLPEEEIPLRAATLIGTWTDSRIITGCNVRDQRSDSFADLSPQLVPPNPNFE
jgi:Putative DNA-binding domain